LPYRQEQDEWNRQLWRTISLAIGEWLTDSQMNLNRPIRSLTLDELNGMAWTAIGTYNDMLEQRARQLKGRRDPLDDDISDIGT